MSLYNYIIVAPDGTPTGHKSLSQPLASPVTKAQAAKSGKPYVVEAVEVRPIFDDEFERLEGPSYDLTATPAKIVYAVVSRGRPLADLQALAKRRAVEEFDRRASAISGDYSATEKETWALQLTEAKARLADPAALAPLLDGLVMTGETVDQLAAAVVAKAQAMQAAVAPLIAKRRALFTQIDTMDEAAIRAFLPAVATAWDAVVA